ncbi:MAG: HlyD family efflux transporter periplasmic adaptor subunit [Chloroflexi bacterium]|nr:HlyD family efflux transporter periplasmic adaptor subunit [Chloroflexota bacterium]
MKRRPVQAIVLLVVALWMVGCTMFTADRSRRLASDEPTPTPIPTAIVPSNPIYKVQRGEVIKELQFTGRVSPVTEKELFFRVNGRVRKVLAERDQMVKAGQLIADLEIDALERDLASSRLNLERAKSRLETAQRNLDSQIKRAQINLEIAELNLNSAKAQDLTPRKTLAAIDLEKADLARKRAQADYDAIAWRNDRAATIQAANLHAATLAYEQALANHELALQSLNNQRFTIGVQERQVQLAQLALDDLKTAGLDPVLTNDVSQAEQAVKKLEAAVSDAQIVAPFDGRILSISVTEGRAATAFQPVVVVGDLTKLDIRADLSTQDVAKLEVDMPARLVLMGRPGDEMAGFIRRLPFTSSLSGSTTKAEDNDKSTRVALKDAALAAKLELGDLVRVTVLLENKKDVVWLPPAAIRSFEGRRFVVVQEGAAQRRVDVKVGIESPDRVEIVEGVQEGQTIVGQ